MDKEWTSNLALMMRFVEIQMETIDVPASVKHGFLHKLIQDLKKQDESSVQSLLVTSEVQSSPNLSRKGLRSSSPVIPKIRIPSVERQDQKSRRLSACFLLKQKAPQFDDYHAVHKTIQTEQKSKRLSASFLLSQPSATDMKVKRLSVSQNCSPEDAPFDISSSPVQSRKRSSLANRASQELSVAELVTMIAPLPAPSLDNILTALKLSGEIELKDGFIFSRRGGAKVVQNLDLERRRRQSFSSTNFSDQDGLLRAERLKEMSDLNFLFSLNGYHLPYCESSKQRSMYEGFFAAFLREVHAGKSESHSFRVLQEAITALYITSELCVDFLECFFEVVGIVRSCSKMMILESQIVPNKQASPRTATSDTYKKLDSALEVFNDIRGVFPQFKSRKLLNSISGCRDSNPTATWLSKYNDYCDVLLSAVEIHDSSCIAFRDKMKSLHDELVEIEESARELTNLELGRMTFCNDIIIYVDSYRDFLKVFSSRGSQFLDLGRNMLIKLEQSPRKKFVRSASKMSGLKSDPK
uniref:Uncharacterized protein n=1 Tax=viral metagenome TaxID=1070528 RepID=A0A6C0CF23_9ZZZZ